MPNRNVAARRQENFFPNPHVAVGRSRIPIHPSNSQIVLLWRKNFQRNSVGLSSDETLTYVKFKRAVSSSNILRIADFHTVDPNIRPVINPQKMQPRIL